jgi:hypothetical protein
LLTTSTPNFEKMMKKLFVVLLLIGCAFQVSKAQDRVFTYTYQTNVLPSGVKELEYTSTLRSGKKEFYNAIDQRFEMELGLGKNVQTAFYFNTSTSVSKGIGGLVRNSEISFSNEWKVKLSDPVANKIGTGLYGEIGFNGDEFEFEGKFLLDKKFGNNLIALNLVGEYEMEYTYEVQENEVETETETPFELDLAFMHFHGSHAGLGLEVRNHNEMKEGYWENSPWFAGPTFHFNGTNWFINFSVLPQLFNAKKEEGIKDNLELNDHEKVEARVLLSFTL